MTKLGYEQGFCEKCGGTEFDKRKRCRNCINKETIERRANWTEEQKDKSKAYNKQYRVDNGEKLRKQYKEYYADNTEKCKNAGRNYRQGNPEIIKMNKKQYYADTIEERKEYNKKWRQDNPDKIKANSHRRRARIAENGGSFTAKEWRDLFEFFDGHCLHVDCLEEGLTYTPNDIHADHVISISNGGTSNIDNMQPLCERHNLSKATKNTDYRLDAIDYLGLDIVEFYNLIEGE